ncbi:PREDICTED: uncharacterized protein LOC105144354 [Acromyrmex echinatior]|uniref:uncharacterized protein LOC105144354 n=1 Tax=Acromyrmex echinatior TaxID=103372 RepID=UPI000580BB0D|nr:PREDICTED: uncharacterized protein LOC105144354 [Acromyrmex echinatior]
MFKMKSFIKAISCNKPRHTPRIGKKIYTDSLQIPGCWNRRGTCVFCGNHNWRQSNNIILPRVMWQAFIERRVDIERFVQSIAPSLSVQGLVIEIVKMPDVNVVKLTLRETCLCI